VLPLWACTAGAACLLAYWGQGRIGELRILIENFTPQWSWRVGGRRTNPDQDQTGLGHIGFLKGSGRIVVRVKPGEGSRVPTLLRTATYREFRTPNNWAARARRDRAGSPVRDDAVYAESRPVDWQLRQTIGDQQVRIAAYLEGGKDVLPLPMRVTRLENLGVFTLRTNGLGVVFADGPGVVVFDAFFANSGSLDSDPTGEADLDIPDPELAAVEAVVAEMDLAGKDLQHQLRTVSAFFQDKFEYSLWQGLQAQREASPTPLARFLLDQRRGHCEYFATATVMILRQLKIPARYAVGWAVQEASGDGYVVRERHAHAWCIYYDSADKQWHELDTTPASWIKEEDARASLFEFLSDFWQRIKFEIAKWRWGQTNIRDYVWWIIGPMLVFLLYRLLRRKPGKRARLAAARDDHRPERFGLDSEFYRVEKKLGELGFIRAPGETQARFVERVVRDVRVAELRDAMFAMLQAHYRLRFDPMGLTPEEREALSLRVREAVARLGRPQVSTQAVPGSESRP
jgi:transglutaminase-like putative cysteine protease